jgi:hypothetical protein
MLRTCAKCGKQFYGVGCPECDFPPQPENPTERKRQWRWGLVFVATGIGVAILALACPQEDLPSWPAFVAGVVFFLTGMVMVTEVKGRLNSALGGVVCAGMASLGFFAAFGAVRTEGGIPFLPAAWNQGLGRIAFGVGACITAAFGLWFFHRMVKPCKKK